MFEYYLEMAAVISSYKSSFVMGLYMMCVGGGSVCINV